MEEILNSIKNINENIIRLFDNQNILNEKLNTISDYMNKQDIYNENTQQQLNNINILLKNNIDQIQNKFADLSIFIQNNMNDISTISSSIQILEYKIEEIKRSIDQQIYYANNVYNNNSIL